MIRAVVFDPVGTLAWRRDANAPRDYDEALASTGLELDPIVFGRWRHRLMGAAHPEASASREAYERWWAARRAELWDRVPLDPAAAARLAAALAVADAPELVAAPGATDALAALAGLGVRTVAAGNAGWDLADDLAALGLTRGLDAVLTSARVGWRKPHAPFYRAVFEACGARPAELLLVSTDRGRDVVGALAVGAAAAVLAPSEPPSRWAVEPRRVAPSRPGVLNVASLDALVAEVAVRRGLDPPGEAG
ncbi:MAG: hypothetical protein OEY23_10370 [Acidimicrobiia bacterium]|nr:hypothetical protein [Acidimicrobiia bacterium]